MKTIRLIYDALEFCAVQFGQVNPLSRRKEIKLNEHVKRKQNE